MLGRRSARRQVSRRPASGHSSPSAELSPHAVWDRPRPRHGAGGDYLRELESRFAGLNLGGKRILLDCANGATHRVAPEIFRRLGADVDAIAVEPDGRNINHGVGSTHIEKLAAAVKEGRYD